MVNFNRPEIDIQSVEAEVLAPMRQLSKDEPPAGPSDVKMARQWREFQAREQWRAGGILAQFLPQSPERMRVPDISGGDGDPREVTNEPADNSWQELLALIGTIEPTELIDPTVGAERLLYRLFHEHGVRVFRGVPVADQCSCSREKIRGILGGFSAEEIKDSTEDGGIHVACEFCSTQYDFDPAEFVAE